MAVAFDASTLSSTWTTTDPFTFDHTPGATPRGVLLFITQESAATDEISGVTYGGVAMGRVNSASDTAGEPGRTYSYFLGVGIPTGTQTVSIDTTGAATTKVAVCVSLTAAANTTVANAGTVSEDAANPQVAWDSGAHTVFRLCAVFSGHDAPASLALLSNMSAIEEHDYGTKSMRVDKQDSPTSGSFTIGYTATSEDCAFVAVAVKETVGVDHDYIEVTTERTTASTSYVDVTGATLLGANFVAGQKYLILVTGDTITTGGATAEIGTQVIHGSTAFADSEALRNQPGTVMGVPYFWWTVWTAVAGEDVKVQIKSVVGTARINNVAMHQMRLDSGLTENTDWFYDIDDTSTTLSSTYSTTNNASISFTPATANHDWLVLSYARLDVVSITISYQTRIDSTGTVTDTQPELIAEPDTDTEVMGFGMMRVFTDLAASTQTFTEKSAVSTTGTTEARTHSRIFALDLDKFQNQANAYTAAEIDLSATDFGTEIQTVSITPTVAGDVLCLGFAAHDGNTANDSGEWRIQVDNADVLGTPRAPQHGLNDARDEVQMTYMAMELMTAAAHTVDFDASTTTAAAGDSAEDRALVAFTMVLAAAGQTIDMWFPGIQQPYPERSEVVGY